MKKLLLVFATFLVAMLYSTAIAGCSDSDPDFIIRPANHPDACVALELENIHPTGTRNWEFQATDLPINAATGLPISPNPYPLPAGATMVVYWTAPGDKRVRYNGGSWEEFHNCNCNPIAADYFEEAPLICNTDFYCGTTSSAYGVDQTGPLECNGGADHEGSLENNSWLRFVASGTSVNFDINVLSGCHIQFAVYAYNPSAPANGQFVLLTNIDWTDIDVGFTGAQTIIANGLTPGNEYYLHFDGHGGAECDYEIGFNSGFAVMGLAASDQLICPGDPVTLTATPNDPSATYVWTVNGGAPFNGGSTLNVNPATTTTYSVSVVLTGCDQTPQEIIVDMDDCIVLPGGLANFNVSCLENYTELSWQTISEVNNDYFVIEKATSDFEFEQLVVVDGAGNSSTLKNYVVKDSDRTAGDVYYRIRQVDFDGTETFSEVVSNTNCSESDFVLYDMYHNATTNELVVNFSAARTTEIQLDLVNLSGQSVLAGKLSVEPNQNQLRIPADQLRGGAMYLFNLKTSSTIKTERIFVH